MKSITHLFLLIATGLLFTTSITKAQTWSTTVPNVYNINTGKVGIKNGGGAFVPSALFQVQNGSVLFDGTTGTTPVTGAGTRMMWIPSLSAFRAGAVNGTQWNTPGQYSAAFGYNNTASGQSSFSVGRANIASGDYSLAMGDGNKSTGVGSVALGYWTNSSGVYTSTMGMSTVAQSYNSFVIGAYNYNPGTYSINSWISAEPLFVIGNGSFGATRNAMMVLKNGNVLINKNSQGNAAYKLDVNGIIRANEVVINTTGADFVFEKEYKLMSLELLEQNINKNKHLPGIPSACEMQKNGVSLSELNTSLLQKVEELTLYIIEQNKRIGKLEELILLGK